MNRVTWLASALALACAATLHAAEKENANILRVFNDSVAPAEQAAYETGIKSYNDCLKKNGFKYGWVALSHETGDVYSYSYVAGPYTWAGFDALGAASKACDATFRSDVNPHLKGEISGFFEIVPEASYLPNGEEMTAKFADVTFLRLKPGREDDFLRAAKKVAASATKAKWSIHFAVQRVIDADRNAADFVVLVPAASWKAFGSDDNAWKMIESVEGKDEADATRKAFRDTIEERWSHADSYNADLSYVPAK